MTLDPALCACVCVRVCNLSRLLWQDGLPRLDVYVGVIRSCEGMRSAPTRS